MRSVRLTPSKDSHACTRVWNDRFEMQSCADPSTEMLRRQCCVSFIYLGIADLVLQLINQARWFHTRTPSKGSITGLEHAVQREMPGLVSLTESQMDEGQHAALDLFLAQWGATNSSLVILKVN